MSDVQRFNLWALALVLFALMLLIGCCPREVSYLPEYRPNRVAFLDTTGISDKARARVEQWKRDGVLK